MTDELAASIASLAERYGLSKRVASKLRLIADCLIGDPHAPTTIRDPQAVVERHLADSLVALELDAVRAAALALDLGSGAGLPGLPLAAALPGTAFVLLESAARKCAFLERTVRECEISNAKVVHRRAESYAEGVGQYDLVTARAVASLAVTAEYAAPLLRVGGTLVAWGAKRSIEAENHAAAAVLELGLGEPEVLGVTPFPGALHRHLYVMSKVMETPARFPRRPGVALKRPLGRTERGGASATAAGRRPAAASSRASSDRSRR